MLQDKYVFAHLVSFLNRSKFNRIVTRLKTLFEFKSMLLFVLIA